MKPTDALSFADLRRPTDYAAFCGSPVWCQKMSDLGPVHGADELHRRADEVFGQLSDADWLDAFAAHPQLGETKSTAMKTAGNRRWSTGEQSGALESSASVKEQLAEANHVYHDQFGFIFILCASGRSAEEMLAALRARLGNDRETEIRIAAAQQREITHLRIDKFAP